MAQDNITYVDKVTSNPQPGIQEENKVTGANMTEIKTVVNDNATDTTTHIGNTSNPHGVTKAQVGLTNADDTSDANKPVSTATQTALDGKSDIFTDVTKTASFSPSGDDNNNFICDSASAMVVTIDLGALTATNKGMSFYHEGTGSLTFINGTGTLVGSPETAFVSEGQNSKIFISRKPNGDYNLLGQTV